MALYMVQFAYTPEAWTAFTKHPEDRTATVKTLAEKLGCQFEALYYAFGEYDGFVIMEAPDEDYGHCVRAGGNWSRPCDKDNRADAPGDGGRVDEEGERHDVQGSEKVAWWVRIIYSKRGLASPCSRRCSRAPMR